jgi:hypothetical protein
MLRRRPDLLGLRQRAVGFLEVTLSLCDQRRGVGEAISDVVRRPGSADARNRLRRACCSRIELARVGEEICERAMSQRELAVVAERAPHCFGFLQPAACRREVIEVRGERSRRRQYACALGRCHGRGALEDQRQPAQTLAPEDPVVPVPTKRRAERQRDRIGLVLETPRQRGTNVVVIGSETRQRDNDAAARIGHRFARRIQHRQRVTALQNFGLANGRQPLRAVLPNRFQQRVPGGRAAAVRHDQRLVDQTREQIEIRIAHDLRRFERETAGEDGQTREQRLLAFGEKREAPVDRRAQSAMTRDRGARAAAENREPVFELRRDLFGREHADARRGELDRQRHAVEPPADLLHGRHVAVAQSERRVDRTRAHGKQLRRFVRRDRRYGPDMFPRHAERLAARGENVQLRAPYEQRLREIRTCGDEMLAVIEHQQDLAVH